LTTCFLIASLVSGGAGAAQDPSAGHSGHWAVKSVPIAGTTLKETKLVLSIENSTVVARQKDKDRNKDVFSIPAAAVVDLLYDNVAHTKAAEAWNSAAQNCQGGACGDPISGGYLLGLFAFSPLLLAVKSHHHLIHILWQSSGNPETEVVEAENANYESLMSALEGLTGKKFRNLPAERRRLAGELSQAMDKGVVLKVDREAVVGAGGLQPGNYNMVLLDRGSGHGEVYFFAGTEKHPLHFLASSPVTLDTEQNNLAAAEAVYGQQGGATTISKIKFPSESLHLAIPLLPSETYKSVRSFYGGDELWAHVTYEQYEGEPAFRFPIFTGNLSYDEHGFLYVTRSGVAYELTRGRKGASESSSGLSCDVSGLRSPAHYRND
jgi:hypothetical protein